MVVPRSTSSSASRAGELTSQGGSLGSGEPDDEKDEDDEG